MSLTNKILVFTLIISDISFMITLNQGNSIFFWTGRTGRIRPVQ